MSRPLVLQDITRRDFDTYFTLNTKLGFGAQSTVWRAQSTLAARQAIGPQLPSTVALKMMGSDDQVGLNEASIFSHLHEHRIPGVVRCYAFYRRTEDRCLILVLDYVAGRELYEMIIGRTLSACNKGLILARLALIIRDLHAAGVVHGDIKLENVVVDESYEPCLIDYGYAIETSNIETEIEIGGTLGYYDPKTTRGNIESRKMGDWWSFGQTAVRVYTGTANHYKDKGKTFYSVSAEELIARGAAQSHAMLISELTDPHLSQIERPASTEILRVLTLVPEGAFEN